MEEGLPKLWYCVVQNQISIGDIKMNSIKNYIQYPQINCQEGGSS